MAYISKKCVTCTEPSKRAAGQYSAKDENGKRFSGHLYECDNEICPIKLMRKTPRHTNPDHSNKSSYHRATMKH